MSEPQTTNPDQLPILAGVPADWNVIGASPGGQLQRLPFDLLLAKLIAADLVKVDEATLQANSQVAYMEMFNQFDCSAVKARTVSGTGYRRDGTVMGDTPGNQDWGTIDPTSPNGEMFDVACRNGRPRGETLTGGNPAGVAASFRLSARGS